MIYMMDIFPRLSASVELVHSRYYGINTMSVFEAAMLICFGVSWPISIAKSVRTKVVSGKSPLFMGVICFGYACGVLHKLLYSMDWIIVLYALNMVLVAVDLTLYFRYLPGKKEAVAKSTGEGAPRNAP